MTDFRGPPASWYDPPEPPLPCCRAYEDGDAGDDHDPEACIAEQAEAAAEARAERMRDEAMFNDRCWL